MSEQAKTPWTQATVDALNAHQQSPFIHPYTCGNDSRHRELVATINGWVCLDCDYRQNWAHQPDADAKAKGEA